MTEDGN